jgi:hypothetical protein
MASLHGRRCGVRGALDVLWNHSEQNLISPPCPGILTPRRTYSTTIFGLRFHQAHLTAPWHRQTVHLESLVLQGRGKRSRLRFAQWVLGLNIYARVLIDCLFSQFNTFFVYITPFLGARLYASSRRLFCTLIPQSSNLVLLAMQPRSYNPCRVCYAHVTTASRYVPRPPCSRDFVMAVGAG